MCSSDGCARQCPLSHEGIGDPLEVIRQNAHHLLRLIDDVLDLSKIEAGRLSLEQTRCSPCRIVAEVASLMRVRAAAKGLSLQVAFDGTHSRHDPVRPDPLATNPAEPGGKRHQVHRSRQRAPGREAPGARIRAGPMLQFQVIDTGIGMSEQTMQRIFQPFHAGRRLHHAAIRRDRIGPDDQQTTGRADWRRNPLVQSTLGRGTTFTVTSPDGSAGQTSNCSTPPRNVYRPATAGNGAIPRE